MSLKVCWEADEGPVPASVLWSFGVHSVSF